MAMLATSRGNETFETRNCDIRLMVKLLNIPPDDSVTVWDPFVAPGAMSQLYLEFLGYRSHRQNYDPTQERAPAEVDFIITNPPFSDKAGILRRFVNWGVPFAMILPTSCIQRSYFRSLCSIGQWHIYVPDEQLKFHRNGTVLPSAPFLSAFFVWRPALNSPNAVQIHYLRYQREID